MVVIGILGILSVLVTRLYNQGLHAWMNGYANLTLQMKVRAARDIVTRNTRNAIAASILVSRTNTAEANFSMLTYVDVYGNTEAVYQEGNDLVASFGRPGQPIHTQVVLKGDLQRFYAYYPDFKDMNKVAFSLYAKRKPYSNAKDVEVLLKGSVDLRNP